MPDWQAVSDSLFEQAGTTLNPGTSQPVSGGCISATWRIESTDGLLFAKTADAEAAEMFQAEAAGLVALADAGGLRVPRPVACGASENDSWLLMEWIDRGPARPDSLTRLAEGLAVQHRVIAEECGWDRDNTIGSTPQENARSKDWPGFFATHRLGFQVDLLEISGLGGRLVPTARRLIEEVPALLAGHRPEPSLLHGDLWGGNWCCDSDGLPCIYDPAVYFGDREADIAMTRLFGGFGSGFYAAYEEAWPLEPGHEMRADLYNLYHVLNHVNLFGVGYLAQAEGIVHRLLNRSHA